MRRALESGVPVALAIMLTACAGGPGPQAAVAHAEEWFVPEKEAVRRRDCLRHGPTPDPLGLELPVQIFKSQGLDDEEVKELTESIARIWAPYGLTFRSLGAPITLDTDPSFLLDGARQFFDTWSRPRQPQLNLVVVTAVVPPVALPRRIAGYGFPSPDLAGFFEMPAESQEVLGFDPMTPTVFLSMREWRRSGQGRRQRGPYRDFPAHEVGHGLGLAHVSSPANLMSEPPRPTCRTYLTQDQIFQVDRTLAGLDPNL